MAKPTSLASIALFLGFAYGFAIAVGLVVFVNGGDFRSPAAGIAVTMMMFSVWEQFSLPSLSTAIV